MKHGYWIIGFLFFTGYLLFAYPSSARMVNDPLGREVSLPEDPRRVVALAPSITEIVFALEEQDRLKGVTRYSDFPPEALKYPKV